ncbi:MAG: branched-chain amino acid ABC transporter permease [Candidatus Nanopelagicales bacterium]
MNWDFIFTASFSAMIGSQAIVFCLGAIGLNVQFGYTGLLNFGQAAFLAVAGYSLALTVVTLELPFWLGLVIGIGATTVLALLLGIPTLRLRADYLAIVTIAAGEIVRLVARSVQFKDQLGGSDGLQGFADTFYNLNPIPDGSYKFGPFSYNEQSWWVIIVGWSLVVVFSILIFLLMRSPWGRVLKGIREDEDAVRSLGKNVYWFKMQALILGGLIGAFAGFVFAVGADAVSPDAYATNLTFLIYVVLILGGAARVLGPILGALLFAFVFQFVDVALSDAVQVGYITFLSDTQAASVRLVLVGVGLMLLMIFRPQGILGDRREIALDAH